MSESNLPRNPYSGEDGILISYFDRYEVIRPIGSDKATKSATVVSGVALTENPHLLAEIGRKISRTIYLNSTGSDNQPCLIGLSATGTILSQAAAMMTDTLGNFGAQRHAICFRAVIGITESPGDFHCWEDGTPSLDRHTYWRVAYDDSNVASILQAEADLNRLGYPTGPLLLFIKRGGKDSARLQQDWPHKVVVCYWLADIVNALAHARPDVWDEEYVTNMLASEARLLGSTA